MLVGYVAYPWCCDPELLESKKALVGFVACD